MPHKKKVLITSALPYVNNQPHLGNIVGSLLSADVYSRFCRKMSYDSFYVCGSDEYGTAIEMEACRQGLHPLDLVLKNRPLHLQIYKAFNISFDYFGHTHSPAHISFVQSSFLSIKDSFLQKDILQYYCPSCSQFLADRYLQGVCECGAVSQGDQCDKCNRCYDLYESGSEFANSLKCVICLKKPIKKSSSHLFLKLNNFKPRIKGLDTEKWSENAKSIYRSWISKDFHDRCITRLLKHSWGVQVPLDEFKDKVFYVWFDAPLAYLTFFSSLKKLEWLNGADLVQFMGKDNVPFHSIIFPSILFALNDKNLFKSKPSERLPFNLKINSTEYLTFNSEKFSKSKKIGIFGSEFLNSDLGHIDKWRFYLMRKRPESKDADFSVSDFIESVNTELIANLGNFINRVLKYLKKFKIEIKSEILKITPRVSDFIKSTKSLYSEFIQAMDKIELRNSVDIILKISRAGNKFLQSFQENSENKNCAYAVCYSVIFILAHCMEPFMPESSSLVFSMIKKKDQFFFPKDFEIISGEIEDKIQIVFKKFTEKQEENLNKFNKY